MVTGGWSRPCPPIRARKRDRGRVSLGRAPPRWGGSWDSRSGGNLDPGVPRIPMPLWLGKQKLKHRLVGRRSARGTPEEMGNIPTSVSRVFSSAMQGSFFSSVVFTPPDNGGIEKMKKLSGERSSTISIYWARGNRREISTAGMSLPFLRNLYNLVKIGYDDATLA